MSEWLLFVTSPKLRMVNVMIRKEEALVRLL